MKTPTESRKCGNCGYWLYLRRTEKGIRSKTGVCGRIFGPSGRVRGFTALARSADMSKEDKEKFKDSDYIATYYETVCEAWKEKTP